jgi:hypothetical protein
MDVVVWLRSLGLGKYETLFRENDIDETVLPSLTHTLKELGVAAVAVAHALGDRRLWETEAVARGYRRNVLTRCASVRVVTFILIIYNVVPFEHCYAGCPHRKNFGVFSAHLLCFR